MKESGSFDEKLNAEIEKRLNTMERPEYVFPTRMKKRDYLVVGITALICLAFLIIGAFL